MKVSIVVPVYNTSKYLKKCIESLIYQTYKEIEIILVNDGSTDQSLEICKAYLQKDSRITLISKKNEGVEKARLCGYHKATGEWVLYVDSDDYLPLEAVEIMLSKIADDVDIVQGNSVRVLGTKGIVKKKSYVEDGILEHSVIMEKYYKSFFGDTIFPVDMWAKLYRKELLDKVDIKNTGLRHGEDLCFNMQIFPYARKIVSVSDTVYCYRWGGMTERMNSTLFSEARKSYMFKCEMLKQYEVINGVENIANELKVFFTNYMESYMIFTKLNREEIVKKCKLEWETEENQQAIEILKLSGKYSDRESVFYLDGELEALYYLLNKKIWKKKIRRKILKFINKVL